MSERIEEIREQAEGLTDLCPEYLRMVIRHVQRNCDFECSAHPDDAETDECNQPDRYDGERMAKALASIPFLLAEVERLEGELAKTKRGAVTLGEIIDRQGRAVLDITGLHHMVDEDMDGDWGAIWDILAEQAAKGRGLQEAQAEAWDEGRHFGQINDHAYPNDNPYRTAK